MAAHISVCIFPAHKVSVKMIRGIEDHIYDLHSCQIGYPFEIKVLLHIRFNGSHLNIGQIVVFMHLNMVWYEILLKYSQFIAELALFFTFCIWCKPSKISSFRTKRPTTLKLGIQHQVL